MNVKRVTARTAREALALVRQALGDDAVVLSTRPSAEGVEVLALAPEGMARIEQAASQSAAGTAGGLAGGSTDGRSAPGAAKPVHLIPAPQAPARPASLAERIAARGERLLGRHEPRREPVLGDGLPAAVAAPAPRVAQHAPPFGPGAQFGPGAPQGAASPNPTQGRAEPVVDRGVAQDVAALGMSTLTFQDYVRERMLKRRQAELEPQAGSVQDALRAGTAPKPAAAQAPAAAVATPAPARPAALAPPVQSQRAAARVEPAATPTFRTRPPEPSLADLDTELPAPPPSLTRSQSAQAIQAFGGIDANGGGVAHNPMRRNPPVLRDKVRFAGSRASADMFDDLDGGGGSSSNALQDSEALMGELRSVRDLIEERFGMLAFMERLQRDPRQVALSQKLFDTGLSPALVRKLVQSLPDDVADEMAWAAGVLERNVVTGEHEAPLEDHAGVFALIGPTGVGKTTSTAKLAAAFATRHGASQLGLITLDAYRVAAHEQLRTYGRILGVPVHTAHDRASLEDLLDLLSAKKLVLIDTAGMAQRDVRTRELLDMLQHRAIKKLLVVNAAAQGETVEDVLASYGVQHCHGVIVSKLDEAVKLGPALDALIRHKAKVVGVANGQRVPEDWHRLSAQALVQRALRGGGGASWRLDTEEVNLMFAATQGSGYPAPQGRRAASLHA